MKRELADQFNREVENYRRALLYHAQTRDWKTFQAKAGRMFDYLESIEFKELERRFFRIFNIILGALIVVVIAVFNVDFEMYGKLLPLKNNVLFSAIAVSSFELYFYIGYRRYIGARTAHYQKRREKFIRVIERDFRAYTARPEEQRLAA